jgi:hypothetical protein
VIDKSRFLVQSADYDEWIRVRATGVTATMVGKAGDSKGFDEVLAQIADPTPIPDNAYMAFGREQEPHIITRLTERFDIEGNDWLIASNEANWMMATPDGLSPDHSRIVEVKTTGRDWGSYDFVPLSYKRQVQWQLFVTGAEECVFAWMLRVKSPGGGFAPAWVGPKYVTVKRQQRMIDDCIATAHKLYAHIPQIAVSN